MLPTAGRAESIVLAGERGSWGRLISREIDRGQQVAVSRGVGIERRGRR